MKHYLKAFILILIIQSACEPEPDFNERIFTIKKGEHLSTRAIEMLDRDVLAFEAKFDESAIYDLGDHYLQLSTNKLMGFADCNSHHHDNSARFGWQWINGQLEIWAYTYVYGERIEKFVGHVSINEYHRYIITIEEDSYLFKLDNNPPVRMKRGKICDKGAYYMLFPYFGGQIPAPHNIKIYTRF